MKRSDRALGRAVGDLTDTVLSMARTRLELFALETGEQKARLLRLVALLCVMLFFLALAVLIFSIGVAVCFWPTPYRYAALWLMGLLYLVIGLGFAWALRMRLRDDPVPYSATLDELRRDAALIARWRASGAAGAESGDGARDQEPAS